jgi:hypothetical protein
MKLYVGGGKMDIDFAIGCMRGGACAFLAGQILSLGAQIITGRTVFLLLSIVLSGCCNLCVWMGYNLEKERP